MRAVVYREPGARPMLAEVAEPTCPADGVIVDVAATGLCRSDWHAWRGQEVVPLPHIPGHEFAGTISTVGGEVSGWALGERVTVPFVLGCGHCEFCRAGDAQVCPHQEQPGFTLPGSFAERLAVPRAQTNLVRLPDEVSFVAAASLGCRFATAFRAVVSHGQVTEGQWVAVLGCGGVGLSAVMIAKALGALVIAVDRSRRALEVAAQLGADVRLELGEGKDLETEIASHSSGGVHVGIDAIGHPDLVVASVRSLRPRGRHVQVGLLHGASRHPAIPMDRVIAQELAILGSHGMPAVDYPVMLGLVGSGTLDPGRLITRRVGLEQAGSALVGLDGAGPGITVIEPAVGVMTRH